MLTPNITPDPDTGIGRWSSADFYRALHDGVNKRNQDMYPTMPYDFYTKVTRADVDAIYAYLRTMKPVRNAVDVNHLDFPFNQRWSMGAWRELYFSEGTFRPDATKTAAWNRGAYLVEGLGHCSDCHSPRNLLGGIEKSKDFTGAVIDGWFALDLTSDIATGLGSWTRRRDRDLPQDRRRPAEDHDTGPDGRGHPQQPELPDRRRLAGDGRVSEVDPARFASAHRPRRAGPDEDARRARSISTTAAAATRRPAAASPACFRRWPAIGVVVAADPNNIIKVVDRGIPARAGFIAMPVVRHAAHRSAGRRHRQLRAHELGQQGRRPTRHRRWWPNCARRRSRRGDARGSALRSRSGEGTRG